MQKREINLQGKVKKFMLKFKPVEITDREWVKNILSGYPCPTLEYNFTTLFIWQRIYNTGIAEADGALFFKTGEGKNMSFLFPAAENPEKAVDCLKEYSENNNIAMNFHGVTEEQRTFLEKKYPSEYEFSEARASSDYVYSAESLRELKGKKLSSKRNHINSFVENNPDWVYEEISSSNIEEVFDMYGKWFEAAPEKTGLAEEADAVKRAFEFYEPLGLSGGLIRTGGNIVAFSMGDELNKNTFLVHIEKAYADIRGAYPMINKQFVINNCVGYEYVNREDDAGDEGLRKAKLSYRPVEIVKKFSARRIEKK